jgi:hypothetical protein
MNGMDYCMIPRNKSGPTHPKVYQPMSNQHFMDNFNNGNGTQFQNGTEQNLKLVKHSSHQNTMNLTKSKNIVLRPLNFNGKHEMSSGTLSDTSSNVSSLQDSNYTRIVPNKYYSPSKMSRNSKNSNFMDSNKKNMNPAIRRLQTRQNLNLMTSTQSQALTRSIFVPRNENDPFNTVQVEGYKILSEIGSGSFALVYKARHEKKSKLVVRNRLF